METGLRRLSDLFVEGAEAYLGDDDGGKPVVIWMNKLNSFEAEEATRDASVRRAERMAELGPDSAEVRGANVEMALWSDQELRERIVADEGDLILMETFQNLQTTEGWSELEDYVTRAPGMLTDEDVKPGDPRFDTLEAKIAEYNERLRVEREVVLDDHMKDLSGIARDKLEAKFMEGWRTRRTSDEWMIAKRTTELFLSARECKATMAGGGRTLAGEIVWDHSGCDHSARFFSERKSLHKVPDGAMQRLVDVFEALRTPPRTAGNSDAPASSSGSSEPSSAPEAPSSPSSQVETPDAVPTT